MYIGFETGRDDILKLMNKWHIVEQAIEQAKKLNGSAIQFNSIIMYGIAGKGESVNNVIETAKLINSFNTNRVITMNLMIIQGTELIQMMKNDELDPPDRRERLIEIKTLIEKLAPEDEVILDTTHPSNIIKIKGTLPQHRIRLLKETEKDIKALG